MWSQQVGESSHSSGDGVAAFRNLLSKHGKNDAYTITDLEDRFSAAPHDFTFGSPARKVQTEPESTTDRSVAVGREAHGITDYDSYYQHTIRQAP